MAGIPQQPSLELRFQHNPTWDTLSVFTANQNTITRLKQTPFNFDDYIICLSGASGSGKSLLAKLWAEKWNAWSGRGSDWQTLANMLPFKGGCYVVDDIELSKSQQVNLWRICVQLQDKRARLLITSLTPPAEWSFLDLPDLRTRLIASLQLSLLLPDDDQCRSLFKQHLARYGIKHSEKHDSVWNYCLIRIPRSYEVIRNFVKILHEEALQKHSDISIPLARKAIARLNDSGCDDYHTSSLL